MSKKSRFEEPFEKEHCKQTQTMLNTEREHLQEIYGSLWTELSSKKSLLVICKILRLFVNTLSVDDKYALLNRDNLTQPIHTQLFQKQKKFSGIFFAILKSILNFEHFLKKDDPYS